MKLGKKGKVWNKARAELKKEFEAKGIIYCEICSSTFALSFHHRNKRRFNDTHIFENVLLLCAKHHQELEYNKNQTQKAFEKLRGK